MRFYAVTVTDNTGAAATLYEGEDEERAYALFDKLEATANGCELFLEVRSVAREQLQ